MAARKKPESEKLTARVPVQVTPVLKKDLDAMAEETGVAVSERVRPFLEELVRKWKAGESV